MKLIDRIKEIGLNRVSLERFHKHNLGWYTGTRVYAVPCPADTKGHIEIFFSQYAPPSWPFLWRIHVRTQDSPGKVAETLTAISDERCNLLSMETLTTQSCEEHEILAFMHVDEGMLGDRGKHSRIVPGYVLDPTYEERRYKAAKKAIWKKVCDSLSIEEKHVLLDPLHVLRNTYLRFQSIQREVGKWDDAEQSSWIEGCVNGDWIIWPSRNFDRLFRGREPRRDIHGSVLQKDSKLRDGYSDKLNTDDITRHAIVPKRGMVYSDSEQKYACLFAMSDDSCIAEMHLEHEERPGVWKALTRKISDAGANIIASHSLRYVQNERCEWRIVLDVSELEKDHSVSELVHSLRRMPRGTIREIRSLRLWKSDHVAKLNPPIVNSFRFTDEHGPLDLIFGRDQMVRIIVDSLTSNHGTEFDSRGEDFLLNGYFKMGKSSILRSIKVILEEHENIVAPLWVCKGVDEATFWLTMFKDVGQQIRNRIQKLKGEADAKNFDKALEQLGAGDSWFAKVISMVTDPKNINLDLGVVKFGKNLELADTPRLEIIQIFRTVVKLAIDGGLKKVVILVDEAQVMLSHKNPEIRESISQIWQMLAHGCPNVRWVIASAERWKGGKSLSGFVAKFRELQVMGLSSEDAILLFRRGFQSTKIYCAPSMSERVCRISGNIPCYIQAIGSGAIQELQTWPEKQRVFDETVFSKACDSAVQQLNGHFGEMYEDITALFDSELINQMLCEEDEDWIDSAGNRWYRYNRLHASAKTIEDKWELRIETVPAFVTHKDDKNFITHIRITPLFSYWARSTIANSSTLGK